MYLTWLRGRTCRALYGKRSPARIHRGAGRALLTSALSNAHSTASRAHTLLRYLMAGDSASRKARSPASIRERAAPCSHRRYPARIPRLQGRILFPVISWQATQRAEKPARPHPSGSGPRPAHHRRYPARSQRLRGRIRFSVISWQTRSARRKARSPASIRKRAAPRSSSALSNAHSTASRWHTLPRHLMAGSLATRPSPSPRPLQRPTSPYLSGSVISCTAPSSFSSIHPPRTASGGVALRQLRRAVIS